MISCVTFETAKIVEPVKFYHADKVHLIHYLKQDAPKDKTALYSEFLDEVCSQINGIGNVEIVKHNEKINDFSEMLRTVLHIISTGEDEEFYINVSAGSSVYTAAAVIASMMMPGTVPFHVGTAKYTVADTMVRDVYYIDGKPVGLTEKTFTPEKLDIYPIDMPKEHLVRALRILKHRIDRKEPTSARYMVEELRAAKLWFKGEGGKPADESRRRQTDAVNYTRDYMDPWLKNGWVKKDVNGGKKPVLTEDGERVLNTFYTD